MRPSKIAFVFMFMILAVGCAAPLTQLQQAEQRYLTVEAEKQREAAEAAAAQEEADAAARAEAEAGKGLSTALLTDAEEKAAMVAGILDRAEAQRQRACVLNPDMEGCKKAEQPSATPPPASQPTAPAPPQPAPATAPAEPFVDFKMNDFSTKGMQRLTPLPVGWEVGYDADKGHIFLAIDGARKYERSKPDKFRQGICYRFTAETVVACPATTVQPPAGH